MIRPWDNGVYIKTLQQCGGRLVMLQIVMVFDHLLNLTGNKFFKNFILQYTQ